MTEISKEEKDLERVIQQWEEIDLDNKRTDWDEKAHKITDNIQNSGQSRSKLVEQTKKFKELNDQSKLESFPTILRSYQEEIDKLTNRSKFSETSYLNVYQLLIEAPNPVPGLIYGQKKENPNISSKKISELEIENQNLKKELEDCEKEFEDLRSQDSTIFKLQNELQQLKESSENNLRQLLEENELKLREEFKQTLKVTTERQEELEREIYKKQEDSQKFLKQLEIAQNSNYELEKNLENQKNLKENQKEMMEEEIENLKSQVEKYEREKEFLKEKSNQPLLNPNLELELNKKEWENTQLLETINKSKNDFLIEKNKLEKEIEDQREEIKNKKFEIEDLTEKLKELPNIEEIQKLKKELGIFRELFGEENLNQGESIEKSLLNQNRKLESQIVSWKNQVEENKKNIQELEEILKKTENMLKQKEQLIQKLEQDINQQGTKNSDDEFDFLENSKKSNLEDSSNMLEIIRNQRDRFGKRIEELEFENNSLNEGVLNSKIEIENLRKDNLSLYEKIRYLSSYNRNNNNNLETNIPMEEIGSSYQEQYEESVHPFVVFSRRERNQRIQNLNPAEKVVFTGSQFFLSSKETRLMTIEAEIHNNTK